MYSTKSQMQEELDAELFQWINCLKGQRIVQRLASLPVNSVYLPILSTPVDPSTMSIYQLC